MNKADKLEKSMQKFYDKTTPNTNKFIDLMEAIEKRYKGDMLQVEERIVEYIINRYYIKTIRDDKHDEVYIYKEGIYHPDAKTYIKEIIIKVLKERYNKKDANKIIDKIMAKTYIDSETFFKQQNKNPYLICVKNGILNLKTREVLNFSPDFYFFNKLDIEYDESADCPYFKEFLKEITSTEDDRLVVQEMFGFSLIKDYFLEKAFIFFGSHGRNGKSKLLEILKIFLGSENTSGLSLEDIEEDQFAANSLRNKLVNIGSDISNKSLSSTTIFKRLTGRDELEVNRKNQSRIKFTNYAKLIFTANELPSIHTTSDAFWQRWVFINFPYRFLPKKDYEILEKEEKKTAFLQKPNIVKKIITPQEMKGILNFSLGGLDRILRKKDFSNKETSKDIKLIWLRNSNSVAAFIMDEIEEDYERQITKEDFKRNYLAYCRHKKIKPVSDKVIRSTLGNEIGATETRRMVGMGDNKKFARLWDGIKFKKGSNYGVEKYKEEEKERDNPEGGFSFY